MGFSLQLGFSLQNCCSANQLHCCVQIIGTACTCVRTSSSPICPIACGGRTMLRLSCTLLACEQMIAILVQGSAWKAPGMPYFIQVLQEALDGAKLTLSDCRATNTSITRHSAQGACDWHGARRSVALQHVWQEATVCLLCQVVCKASKVPMPAATVAHSKGSIIARSRNASKSIRLAALPGQKNLGSSSALAETSAIACCLPPGPSGRRDSYRQWLQQAGGASAPCNDIKAHAENAATAMSNACNLTASSTPQMLWAS